MAKNNRTNEAAWLEKAGRWSIKVQRNGERRQFTSSLPGKKGKLEAERRADEWLDRGVIKDKRFAAAYADFLNAKGRECSAAWVTKLECMGRLWLAPTLEHKYVSTITTQDWRDCILAAHEQGRSRKTLEDIRGAITNFLTWCEDAGVETRPVRRIKIPADAPVGERKILCQTDIRTLFSADSIVSRGAEVKCWYIHAWRLMVITGLRRGELCGLQRDDIGDGRLHVRRSINSRGEITQGKTRAAQRVIVLPDHALRVLGDQAAMLRAAGVVSPWVFPGRDGQASDPNILYKRWLPYRTQHGITEVSLHELRHTNISYLQDAVPETALKRMVGHTRSMDTIGIYGHEVDGEAQKAAAIVDDVFNTLF